MEVACLLLDSGANRDCWNHNGMTALMLANQFGREEISRFLLEAGGSKPQKMPNPTISILRVLGCGALNPKP